MSIQVAQLPALGQVAGRPRKEALYDTDGCAAAAAAPPAQVFLFANPNAFGVAGLTPVKAAGRDTNLTGAAGSLPRAQHFLWYGVQHRIHALGSNLTTLANVGFFELVSRARDIMTWQFNFGNTPYIQTQLRDIPSNVSQFVQTTHGATTTISDCNGEGGRRHYDVTISGQPQSLTELESFRVIVSTAAALGFLALAGQDLFHTSVLRGVNIKGITG